MLLLLFIDNHSVVIFQKCTLLFLLRGSFILNVFYSNISLLLLCLLCILVWDFIGFINTRLFLFTFFILLIFSEIYILFWLYFISTESDYLFLIDSRFYLNMFGWYVNPLSFLYDKKSLVFSIITLKIGLISNVYTVYYLGGDPNFNGFLKFLNIFIISMVFLTKTNSILSLVFYWEFLGISSFFLIGHYHKKPFTIKAAFKAFGFNRLSDLFFFLFISLYMYINGSFSIFLGFRNNFCTLEFIMLFFLTLTSFIKSAQSLFFFWLPDSMEAPIPASALIHSATLVAAGIYLCIRFNSPICGYWFLKNLLIFSGILSATIFSYVSSMQTDIKRLLAYSTIANCGFMYFLIGLESLDNCLFYFSYHGVLKSSLFFLYGFLVLKNSHEQDFQNWCILKYSFVNYCALMLLFLYLGSVNLTMVYDVKHVLFNNLIGSCVIKNSILLALFYVYSINSFIYSTRLISFLNYKNIEKISLSSCYSTLNFLIILVYVVSFSTILYMFVNKTYSCDFYSPKSGLVLFDIIKWLSILVWFLFSFHNQWGICVISLLLLNSVLTTY